MPRNSRPGEPADDGRASCSVAAAPLKEDAADRAEPPLQRHQVHPGGAVRVSWTAEDGRVLLRVRDTGIGIAPDKLERVFEPLVQFGRSLSSAHEGTGLGLAISRDLARAMGGDLTAESVSPARAPPSPWRCRGRRGRGRGAAAGNAGRLRLWRNP